MLKNAVEVVSNSPVELNGDRENVRVRETNLGNVVADSLYQYGQTGFSHPTDIAVTNGGGFALKPLQKANRSLKEMSLPFFHLGILSHKSSDGATSFGYV